MKKLSLKSFKAAFAVWFNSALQNVLVTCLVFILFVWLTISQIVLLAEQSDPNRNIKSFGDAIWWGVVTLLTVGYGDHYPVTTMGKMFATVLMVAGVTTVGIITAKISSFFLEQALNERRGFVDEKLLKQHLIVCGWRDDMQGFLLKLIESNRDINPAKIVVITQVTEDLLENIHSDRRLKLIKVVRGEFFAKNVLERAAPERAKKVLIVADRAPNIRGMPPTLSESDARTIMTAMTLSNIAKGVPIVAEILDPSMDQYLKLAHVNEIIYSRDYSRLLLAKSAGGTGIPNIIYQLIHPESEYFLTTHDIPKECVLRSFADLKKHFKMKHPNVTIFGILENSGNAHSVKESALKLAQQTPDIQKLVENLQTIKSLKFNHPVLGPDDDYMIANGSLAIVIEHREKQNQTAETSDVSAA